MPRAKIFILASVLSAVAGLPGLPAAAAEFSADAAHTQVFFRVKHLGLSWVTGRFEKFTGTFDYDAKTNRLAAAKATIEATSVNTSAGKRDDHLRSSEFFDVAKFPTITFASREVTPIKDGAFKIMGDLTIHGVTRPVTLDATWGGAAKDPWGNERAAFEAKGTIARKDFGLTWNKALDNGGVLVGEDVIVSLEIEGVQSAPAAPSTAAK